MVRGSLDKKWVCHTKPSISPRGRISEAKKSANFPKFSFFLRPLQAIFVKTGKMGLFQFWKGHCHYFCSGITHITYWVQKIDIFRQKPYFFNFLVFKKFSGTNCLYSKFKIFCSWQFCNVKKLGDMPKDQVFVPEHF